ncbi:histidine--tRNA ligase [Marinicella pacifica]|uniref:Histidine--tRNA ligase n=2 Tax=Marinicella pacifica TaxID=1171543 RepID=A0A917CJX2_9GAMM|nr:histidine--tRNA ligase [Marinicella pacifica]
MYDVTPDLVWVWQKLEAAVTGLLHQYGYQEIRFPLLEKTALFHSAIGEVTDVVEKEMFTFSDRKGVSISLRPEGTASTVRAVLENGLVYNEPQKLWYSGPMFRYEKPQKGRNRQFSQIGVEVFGYPGPEADAELLLMTHRLWQQLGIDNVRLELNTLGSADCRAAYRSVLIKYFEQHLDVLDEEAKNRLHSNPLRLLDAKNPAMQTVIKAAPSITDYLSDASKEHFARLCAILDACDVPYDINQQLVRGLDYYSHNVFEWITDELGAQGTLCAGGRYDALVEMQGGKPTAATGFAMGVDRLVELIVEKNIWQPPAQTDVYVVWDKQVGVDQVMAISEQLRSDIPGVSVMMHLTAASFKSQFKKADKAGARFTLILGPDEMAQQQISVKTMQDRNVPQQQLSYSDMVSFLKQQLSE